MTSLCQAPSETFQGNACTKASSIDMRSVSGVDFKALLLEYDNLRAPLPRSNGNGSRFLVCHLCYCAVSRTFFLPLQGLAAIISRSCGTGKLGKRVD